MKENGELLLRLDEMKKEVERCSMNRTPETLEHYRDMVKSLERKLRDQNKRRSCDKCLQLKVKEFQSQAVQVSNSFIAIIDAGVRAKSEDPSSVHLCYHSLSRFY